MPTLEQIRKQIESLEGVEKLLGSREIKELPKILHEGEHIEGLVQGWYENGTGLLVSTNKRLLFVDKGLVAGVRVEDFPYDKISSIQYKTGLVFGEITIFASGNKAEIKQVEKSRTRAFAEYVRAKAGAPSAPETAPTAPPPAADDTVSKLERLAELKAKGILTEEEFAQQKKKLLDG